MTGAGQAAEYHQIPGTYDILMPAFARAYPGRDPAALEHSVRNFSQVVSGVIDLAMKQGFSDDGEVSPRELANSMVVWCVANSRLEDYFECSDRHAARSLPIPSGEVDALMSEIVTRAADWLIGVEALKCEPFLYSAFIKGSAALGDGWADLGD
jgi:hypothetical protein